MGGAPGTKTSRRNDRARESFKKRFGMTRSEWSEYKKTATADEVKDKRNKAYFIYLNSIKTIKQPE